MHKKLEPAIIDKPYKIVAGGGYRCFDGTAWHNCDKYGNVKE